MARWIGLLRGINVGGANRLAMADLRTVMGSLGHTQVTTYIQSGNIVFTAPEADRASLAAEISAAIEAAHGLLVSTVLRTPDELIAALAANPFTDVTDDSPVYITFLSARPSSDDAARLEHERFLPERFELGDSEIYLHYPNGSGRSKMTLDYFEKRLRVRGTSRNLNTVGRLIELSTG